MPYENPRCDGYFEVCSASPRRLILASLRKAIPSGERRILMKSYCAVGEFSAILDGSLMSSLRIIWGPSQNLSLLQDWAHRPTFVPRASYE